MKQHSKKDDKKISIVEAVETLSNIAELDFDREIGVTETHDMIVQGEVQSYRTVHWLRREDADATIEVVKETFTTVLDYLKGIYRKYGYFSDQKMLEGIKTIMVLVGEAAKRLDKYTTFFKEKQEGEEGCADGCVGSATDLEEYKQLQEFYHKKIVRQIDESLLGKWLLALTKEAISREEPMKASGKKRLQTKHVFVDLESVKKDTEYELFFMRKEDGTRFFNPRHIRNIKLVCDFGDYFKTSGGEDQDPMLNIQQWQDQYARASSKNILTAVGPTLRRFYEDVAKIKNHDLVADLKMAVMALLLSSNEANLSENHPIKSCFDYFGDFQVFMRRALHTREYQKLIAYPIENKNKVGIILKELVHKICETFFIQLKGYHQLIPVINNLVVKALASSSSSKVDTISSGKISQLPTACQTCDQLQASYSAMSKLLKSHANGPLMKVLDFLQEEGHREFDVLIQHNIPNHWFDLCIDSHHVSHDRIPCPTHQEFIHRVAVLDEFKEFLRDYSLDHKKHLIFNLQDRTSWREHFRSLAIEDLQKHSDFHKTLTVVTLATETEFYHQLPPYDRENDCSIFFDHLREHLKDESGGCYFPSKIKKALFPDLVNGLIGAIHRVFFKEKVSLSREERMDFIQIFYLFLELKIIEMTKSDSFSFSCKDGIDSSCANTALLFIFLSLASEEHLNEEEMEYLNLILYGPSLIVRERLMLPERFQRMLGALKTIERRKVELGLSEFAGLIREEFGQFFKVPLSETRIALPKVAA